MARTGSYKDRAFPSTTQQHDFSNTSQVQDFPTTSGSSEPVPSTSTSTATSSNPPAAPPKVQQILFSTTDFADFISFVRVVPKTTDPEGKVVNVFKSATLYIQALTNYHYESYQLQKPYPDLASIPPPPGAQPPPYHVATTPIHSANPAASDMLSFAPTNASMTTPETVPPTIDISDSPSSSIDLPPEVYQALLNDIDAFLQPQSTSAPPPEPMSAPSPDGPPPLINFGASTSANFPSFANIPPPRTTYASFQDYHPYPPPPTSPISLPDSDDEPLDLTRRRRW